ncbi:MAG: IS1634 family transposase, partial [Thermoplasmata archaeon]
GHITTRARNKAISAHENRMGRFILVSNAGLSALECLSIYRERDSIEKAFRSLKTDLDVFPLREHKESTVKGMLFVFFLSMIIRSILLRGMDSSKLSRKYSIESMLIELEKLHMIEDQAGSLREIERTRKQKDILEALESISWW